MGLVNLKSTGITNRDASPRVIDNPGAFGGMQRQMIGQVTVATGNSVNSTYLFGQIPSNAVIKSLSLFADSMGSNTAASFGLQLTTDEGATLPAAGSNALFASAKSLHTAVIAGTDILHDATGSNPVTAAELPVWGMLGLASDPGVMYDLVAILTTAADAGGNMALKASYSV